MIIKIAHSRTNSWRTYLLKKKPTCKASTLHCSSLGLSLSLFLPQFFQLEVYNSDGSRMTESQIHSQLLRIRSQSWKTDKEPMGILTSEHRHTWGEAYNRLLRGETHSVGLRGSTVACVCGVFEHRWGCIYIYIYMKKTLASFCSCFNFLCLCLCDSDKLNKESVQLIETGLFSLCLDSPVMRISDEKYAHTHTHKHLFVKLSLQGLTFPKIE